MVRFRPSAANLAIIAYRAPGVWRVQHQAHAVGAGVNLQFFGNADKAGIVAVAVADRVGKHVKPIQRRARRRRNRRESVLSLAATYWAASAVLPNTVVFTSFRLFRYTPHWPMACS